jgi:metal-responsive CopG/Arc/MetJ family transcriptional regulator
MRPITVLLDEEIAAEAETIADEKGLSVSAFFAEAVKAAIQEHKRQRALQRIEDEVMGTSAPVSREDFDEAQRRLRGRTASQR